MSELGDSGTAACLRVHFDRVFAELPEAPDLEMEALLDIWVGGDPYAIRASEISGLARGRPIALMPGDSPAFLGLAGLRGALLPVWDLALALGYPRAERAPWLAIAVTEPAWALAFERFESYRLLSKSALRPREDHGPFSQFSSEGAEIEGKLRPILDLGQILKTIRSKNTSNLKGIL